MLGNDTEKLINNIETWMTEVFKRKLSWKFKA